MVALRLLFHLLAHRVKALPQGFTPATAEHFKPQGLCFAKTRSQAASKPLPAHLLLGAAGENRAARYLEKKGYLVLAQNWRAKQLELDLVCKDEDTVVFVEVKTRSVAPSSSPSSPSSAADVDKFPAPLASPESAFSPAKQARLIKAAAAWLSAHNAWSQPCRFDLICIVKNGDHYNLEHYCHVIELSNLVAGGHTAWQPW